LAVFGFGGFWLVGKILWADDFEEITIKQNKNKTKNKIKKKARIFLALRNMMLCSSILMFFMQKVCDMLNKSFLR
jgi:hypothetical protein